MCVSITLLASGPTDKVGREKDDKLDLCTWFYKARRTRSVDH